MEGIWQFVKDNAAAVAAAAAVVAVLIGVFTDFIRTMTKAGVGLFNYLKRKKKKASERSVEAGPEIEPVQAREPEETAAVPPDDISIGRLPITGEHLFGREAELARLDQAWADPETNVISLVAWGGVGKSALVNYWLGTMAKENYRGARRVYGVSFYSQGTKQTAVAADTAMDEALRWFGDPDPAAGSPWDKGERLAKLVREVPTLLILDGLEPLQNPPGPDAGRLKDPALQSLVRELAAGNPGLCVITTRHRVADIEHLKATTAPFIELDYLSDEAGAALLRELGVEGPDAELRQASHEFGGHGLALNLLGTYLHDVCQGDIRRRDEISLLDSDVEQGGHAKRVMESYEKWLGDGPELATLRIIGLFDRPADSKAVAALREPPAIPELTDDLQDLTDAKWRQTLAKLRRAGLLAEHDPDDPDTLDAHPLVREHFGQQLREDHPDAWREGNDRLYEYYKAAAPELPDTLEEMAPLFAAVAHGCAAGRHQEALDEVYYPRIQRGGEINFCFNMLGAVGADTATVSNFFTELWSQPIDDLAPSSKVALLGWAGFRLRALGRLAEAVEPLQAALDAAIEQQDWRNATRAANNLSELYLTMGELPQASDFARQGVDFAGESGDAFMNMTNRTALAAALFQAGRAAEAQTLFGEAEAMQEERQSEYPLLYSVQGFRYCNLLLDQGKHREVRERAEKFFEWRLPEDSLRDIALDHLSLGLANLAGAQEDGTGDFVQSAEHLDLAVDGLRQAGTQEFISSGLLARATLHRVRGDFEPARRDLNEAMAIAERCGMGLHRADAHLEFARLYLAMGDEAEAREHLAVAKESIGHMGYHRRDGEVAELEGRLGAG